MGVSSLLTGYLLLFWICPLPLTVARWDLKHKSEQITLLKILQRDLEEKVQIRTTLLPTPHMAPDFRSVVEGLHLLHWLLLLSLGHGLLHFLLSSLTCSCFSQYGCLMLQELWLIPVFILQC